MKRQAYTLIAMIVLVGSMAVVAKAQTISSTEFRANIPFEFSVGKKTLPAGEYTLRQTNRNSDLPVLQIKSRNGNDSALVRAMFVIGSAPETAKLVFHRYGNQYFFAEAWVDGDTSGLRAPKTRAERVAQRELAGIKPTAETVALKQR